MFIGYCIHMKYIRTYVNFEDVKNLAIFQFMFKDQGNGQERDTIKYWQQINDSLSHLSDH